MIELRSTVDSTDVRCHDCGADPGVRCYYKMSFSSIPKYNFNVGTHQARKDKHWNLHWEVTHAALRRP